MKLRMLSFSALLCLSLMIIGAQMGWAQALETPEPEWLTQMYQEGWRKVAEGVLERNGEAGEVETFTYGKEGLQWMVRKLEQRVSSLEQTYNAHPSEELARVIDRLKGDIAQANASLNTAPSAESFDGEQLENCDISYGAHASAGPLSGGTQGVTASASSYFHNNCGYVGDTYAYAYVQGANGSVFSTKTQEDPKYSGTWVDSAAQWSLGASSSCYSSAYARASSPSLGINYETSAENYSCPPPVYVTVSGPSPVDTYGCANVTWYATISGGTPGYSIYWYINGTYQGSGTTLTQTYCNTNGSVTAQANVYDAVGQSHSGSFTTQLTYDACGGDPCCGDPCCGNPCCGDPCCMQANSFPISSPDAAPRPWCDYWQPY